MVKTKKNITRISGLLLVIMSLAQPLYAPQGADVKAYSSMKALVKEGKLEEAEKKGREFLRKFQQSSLLADVRLLLADIEDDPEKAIRQYGIVREKYRYYSKRDYAQYRICEIYFFLSQWEDLYREASRGIKIFPQSGMEHRFRYLKAVAAVQTSRINTAEKECLTLVENHRSYNSIARALLLLAYISRRKSGYSREYIYNLREIALGFQKADITPSNLYLLGKFYESRDDINRAWSAYHDVNDRFPRSPEAHFASRRISELKKLKPEKVAYLPDEQTVRETDQLNISPEIDLQGDAPESSRFYALTVGPLYSMKDVDNMKAMLREFSPLKTARVKRHFTLYLGNYSSTEKALEIKIRLAEEFGINSHIVRISKQQNRQYIYGE